MRPSGYLAIVGLLILVYLLVRNASGAKQVIDSLATANVATIATLQGNTAFNA